MDRTTVDIYQHQAAAWRDARRPLRLDDARAFADRADQTSAGQAGAGPVLDLGCGPGWHAPVLGPPDGRGVVALDAAGAMLDLVPEVAPGAWRIQADLGALPLRGQRLGGAWAARSYVHVPRSEVPLALADLHRSLAVGAPIELHLFPGDLEHGALGDDRFAGRRFSLWPEARLVDVIHGAGFAVDALEREATPDGTGLLKVRATRQRTLADTVGPGMRLLVSGLNPSVYAADAGIPFARGGNRFWPAAVAAGLASRDRDPVHALVHHGLGLTDLVKRATPRADVLRADEYRAGLDRLDRLAAWLQPGAICFVGLAGWRAAVDRTAVAGPQPTRLGGRPVYIMGSTSGVNGHSSLDQLTEHLRNAAALADGS